jgi:hypothetical protein
MGNLCSSPDATAAVADYDLDADELFYRIRAEKIRILREHIAAHQTLTIADYDLILKELRKKELIELILATADPENKCEDTIKNDEKL